MNMQKKTRKISSVFQRWLTIIVMTAFILSILFSWVYQTRQVRNNAVSLLTINIQDVRQDAIDASDENLLNLTRHIAQRLDEMEQPATSEDLCILMSEFDVAEINVIDHEGIITATTHPPFMAYDMQSGSQSAEFMVLLSGEQDSYVQSYQPTSHDPSISRKYAGVTLQSGGFVQVGYDAERFQKDIDQYIVGVTRNRHVGENGCVIVANENWLIVSDRMQNEGKNLVVTGIWIDRDTMPAETLFSATVYGKKSYCMYTFSEGYYIISVIPMNELLLTRNTSVMMNAIRDIVVFLELSVLIVILVRKLVIENIDSVNSSLSRITDGKLDEVVNVRNSEEFSSLSDDINSTVTTLKKYIADASARIDQELEFARVIQVSALPREFPKRNDFQIYAIMDPAKEVGGDFYDFFMIGKDHLALVIADVSGKGIPAAMFMMTAKSLIKNRARLGESPEEILEHVNNQLCEGNDAELFVTVWLAIIELSTGKGLAVNAGHEHPVLRRAGGTYELLKYRHAPAVALEEDVRFRQHTFELSPGDSLFVYTDGVPEAHNMENKLFGVDRMLETLNRNPDASPKDMLGVMRSSIDEFAGDAPQFDDITMIGFTYYGPGAERTEQLTVEATMECMHDVLAMVNRHLRMLNCPDKIRRQVGIAVEEIYVNIASYAYAPGTGPVTVCVKTERTPAAIEITLIDRGIPYDPLKKPDPDFSSDLEDRPIGGMGIYMVKKSMDEMTYERRDDQNILRLMKRI